jgi:hypothetical protein
MHQPSNCELRRIDFCTLYLCVFHPLTAMSTDRLEDYLQWFEDLKAALKDDNRDKLISSIIKSVCTSFIQADTNSFMNVLCRQAYTTRYLNPLTL